MRLRGFSRRVRRKDKRCSGVKKRPWSDFAEEVQSHLAHEADQLRGTWRRARECRNRGPPGFRKLHFDTGRGLSSAAGLWWWDQISGDLRHALRLFWRRPGFSAVVVLTLALGIGANTAIFSVINAVLLRPLPYFAPERLAMLWSEDSAHGLKEGRVSLLNFADWKSRSHTFEDMTVFIGQTFLLGNNDGPPERMRSARVPANFFPLLGVEPILGRVFTADEERRREAVAILSYGLWQRRFGRLSERARIGHRQGRAQVPHHRRDARVVSISFPRYAGLGADHHASVLGRARSH